MLPFRLALCLFTALAAGASSAQDKEFERARQIVAGRCFLCHGSEGESTSEVFPRLAGQHPLYIAKQLEDFQSGRRKSSSMNEMAKGLTPGEIAALGRFFAAQMAEPHVPSDAQLAARGQVLYSRGNAATGVEACANCHGARGEGTAALPRLAGQHAQYLEAQLRQFNTRARTNDNAVMHAIASRLTEPEARALAEYLSAIR
jgi:cytochrome c553